MGDAIRLDPHPVGVNQVGELKKGPCLSWKIKFQAGHF